MDSYEHAIDQSIEREQEKERALRKEAQEAREALRIHSGKAVDDALRSLLSE